jgi:hypothetical protein
MDLESLQGLLKQYGSFSEPNAKDKQDALNMGLLQAGLGILMNSGPERGYKPPLGPALGAGGMIGLQGYNQSLKDSTAYKKAGLDEATKLMAIQNEMRKQKALEAFQTGDVSTDLQGGPTNENGLNRSQGGLRYSPASLVGLATAYPEISNALLKIHEAQNPNLSFNSGFSQNPKTGQIVPGAPVIPHINQQGFGTQLAQDPGAQGGFRVRVPPGAAEAYAQQQQIGERAKAGFDVMTIPPTSPTSPPTMRSRLDVLGMRVPPEVQATRDQGRLAVLNEELASEQAKPASPEKDRNLKLLQQEISRTTPGAAGMSPVVSAEVERGKTGALRSASNHADLIAEYEKKIVPLTGTMVRLDRLEQLNASDKTYAAAGAEFKQQLNSIAQAFGVKVDPMRAANNDLYIAQLGELLKERLGSKDYGSGVSVSNLDTITATKPLPDLAKTREGRAQIIDALRADAKRSFTDISSARNFYYDNNNSLTGFRYPSEQEFVRDQVKSKEPGGQPIDFGKLKRGR